MNEDIFNHHPVYKHFLTSADNLQQACDRANITSGLEPIEEISKEIASRWQVMNQVVGDKQQKLETTKRQLQNYKEKVDKLKDLLNKAEDVLQQQSDVGLDLDQAKANRETLLVSLRLARRLSSYHTHTSCRLAFSARVERN